MACSPQTRSEVVDALTQVKAAAHMPRIERPHAEIDLDKAHGVLERPLKTRRHFSSAQKSKLVAVYFAHAKQMAVWREVRRLKVYYRASGSQKARWDPPWPKIDWQRVAHDCRVGVHASSEEIKRWVYKFGKQLRAEIRGGVRLGLPSYMVRSRLASPIACAS